ncbi:MAG: hypothetical protein U9R66_11900 [Thermodesulfobacteriota bacterium]|nr:hypothetical protein [Thermodesulfobacteriota bacterium]
MFSRMIASLQKGEFHSAEELGPRFHAAVVKKMGVLKQPFLCRSQDKKINPSLKEMLWAAFVLKSRESVETVVSLITSEEYDSWKSRKGQTEMSDLSQLVDQKISRYVVEFYTLAPDEDFKAKLAVLVGELMNG